MDARTFVEAIFSERGDAFDSLAPEAWDGVHAIAAALDAEALLEARLRAWGKHDAPPPHVSAALAHTYKNNVVHALTAEKELDDVLARFTAERVDVAPLKGAALMRLGVHRDVGARYMHDLDLLVRPRDRRRVRALLDARGYAEAPDGESPKHLPPLRRGRIYVELHEFAYWEADGARVDLDAWFDGASAGGLDRVATHLVHHLFRSSVTEPILALKTMWDFAAIGARRDEMPAIERAAARAGLSRELGIVRALSTSDAPDATRRAALDACMPLDAAAFAERVFAFHVGALLHAPLWYRALHARSILVPSPHAMEKIEGRSLRGVALARAYATRPLRLALKVGRGIIGRR